LIPARSISSLIHLAYTIFAPTISISREAVGRLLVDFCDCCI
jgi:hypothetical protein